MPAGAIAAVLAGRTSGEIAIAAVIAAARPKLTHIAVDLGTIRGTDRTSRRRVSVPTPSAVRVALLELSRGNPVEPFRFTL